MILSSGGWGKKGAAFRGTPVIQTWKAAFMGKIGESPLSDQEAAAVTPVQVPAHSIDSGVNQKRHRRERRCQNRLMGSW